MKRIIETNKAPKAVGPYSLAVEAGNILYISGQIPIDPITGKIEKDKIEHQTRQVMNNLKNIIDEAGYRMENIVKCTCLLTDLTTFKIFNNIYAEYFDDNPPARVTFQVAALPLGALLEVDAIAVKE